MTSKYLRLPKMQGMVAGNRSRETQDKDETMTSQIERMTSQIVSNTFVTMAAANRMAEDRHQFCRSISAGI